MSAETLARLVDDEPTPEEAGHLAECTRCAREMATYREQTSLLGGLPEIMPPKGDWRELEVRLRSEGLLETPGVFQTLGLARTPSWMRTVAAVLLFLGGAGTGVAYANSGNGGVYGPVAAEAQTLEDAASAMRVAEESYVAAFTNYRELLAREGGESVVGDPISRFAALEHLVSVSQAAVRQAPADPFLNGVLTSALAERDAMARLVSVGGDNWF